MCGVVSLERGRCAHVVYSKVLSCAITSPMCLVPGSEGLAFTRSVARKFQFTNFACVKLSVEFMPTAGFRKTNIKWYSRRSANRMATAFLRLGGCLKSERVSSKKKSLIGHSRVEMLTDSRITKVDKIIQDYFSWVLFSVLRLFCKHWSTLPSRLNRHVSFRFRLACVQPQTIPGKYITGRNDFRGCTQSVFLDSIDVLRV